MGSSGPVSSSEQHTDGWFWLTRYDFLFVF